MKNIWRDICRSSVISIGMAMAIFCTVGVIFDLMYGGQFSLEGYRFTKMVVGCLVIGLGFGIPSVIYKKDQLPLPIRVIIHMGTGLTVYLITAYAVGWIGAGKGVLTGFLIPLIVQVGVALLIWLCFWRYYRKEAQVINDRIQEMK